VFLLPAPLALAIGIWAIADLKKQPDKHGMGRAIFGVVMGGLGTLLLLALVVAGSL
jgi:S-formylglutathione hydrolase FrmB